MNIKERLQKSKEFYQEMWAFHLQSVTHLIKNNNSDVAWMSVIQESKRITEKYQCYSDYIGAVMMNAIDEIEKTVKGK